MKTKQLIEIVSDGVETVPAAATCTGTVAFADSLLADMAGAGLESVKAADILIPRVGILQDMSPQTKAQKPEYIEGAMAGQICDVGTGVILGLEFVLVPVHYSKVWLEWYPRKSGKGLAAIHTQPTILLQGEHDENNRLTLKNGNSIVETAQIFGLNLHQNGDISPVFIPFSSTQLKKCKKLLTLATSERIDTPRGKVAAPLFFRSYTLSTVEESNAQGDWWGWKIERSLEISKLPNFLDILESIKIMRSRATEDTLKGDVAGDEILVGEVL